MKKEELQAQLDGIKNIIVDSDGSMPISGKSFIVWGVISFALFLGMPILNHIDAGISYLYMLVLIAGGLYFSKKNTDKVNEEKERGFSKHQKIVGFVFSSHILFGALLTVIFAMHLDGNYIISTWLVLIGSFYFIFGSFSKEVLRKFGVFFIGFGLLLGLILIFLLKGSVKEESILISNISNILGGVIFGVSNIVLGKKIGKS